ARLYLDRRRVRHAAHGLGVVEFHLHHIAHHDVSRHDLAVVLADDRHIVEPEAGVADGDDVLDGIDGGHLRCDLAVRGTAAAVTLLDSDVGSVNQTSVGRVYGTLDRHLGAVPQ